MYLCVCVACTNHVTDLTQNIFTVYIVYIPKYKILWYPIVQLFMLVFPAAENLALTGHFCLVVLSRYEGVYEIPLWEDQPASPSS